MKTTVTERGQTVVPAQIRRDHSIEPKTRLEWIDDNYTIHIVPIPSNPIRAARNTTQKLLQKLLLERERERADR